MTVLDCICRYILGGGSIIICLTKVIEVLCTYWLGPVEHSDEKDPEPVFAGLCRILGVGGRRRSGRQGGS